MISIEPPMAADDDISMLEACAIANAAFHANLGEEGGESLPACPGPFEASH